MAKVVISPILNDDRKLKMYCIKMDTFLMMHFACVLMTLNTRSSARYIPAGHGQSVDEIVNAVGEKVQITNDFLSLFVALVVVMRTFFVRVFKYFFKNQKRQNSTCIYYKITNDEKQKVFVKELLCNEIQNVFLC